MIIFDYTQTVQMYMKVNDEVNFVQNLVEI